MSEVSPAEEVFFAALDRTTPAERAAYLDEACTGQPELRAQVEKLLAAHPRVAGFLESGAAGDVTGTDAGRQSATTDLPNHTPGTVVASKYKLLQQIGEGGMGSVWMADQTEPIKRRVAVKLIRVERSTSKTILSRFEAERQAIALMDHPHIAKLLDAGTTDTGSPFFVMELVKGVPLNEFCDSHRLSIPDRLHLFMQICSAVQHAHQKGIIHRDLKPSNILVESHDGKPVPKVIDFGLAKATSGLQLTEHTLFTGFGSVLGTPQYMAPEQANFNAVDVDTRADVYALGVILYELLTGTTPLTRDTIKKAALDEVLKLIREQEAPTPSSRFSTLDSQPSVAANRQTELTKLGRFVRGELDWIVMKALSKERDRRYETANGFAKDVERFLNHEPVQAGPPSTRYKLKKFVRRNRPQVIASGLVLFVLLAGIVGTTFGLIQTARQRNRAVAAEEETSAVLQDLRGEQERTKTALIAEKTARGRTRAALNAMTDDVIEKLFARQQELGANEKAFLRRVLTYYEEFAREQGNTEEARAIAAEGQRRVARVRSTLGESREAAECYRVAIRAYKTLTTDFPAKPEYRAQLVACHNNLGILLNAMGSLTEAEREYRSAVELAEKLSDELPGDPFHPRVLAISCRHLGLILDDTGRRSEAAKLYERALAIQRKLAEQHPRDPRYQQEMADCHNSLAVLLSGLGRRTDADEQFQLTFAIRKKLAADYPKVLQYRRELGDSHYNLGILLERQGSFEKALEHHRLAVAIKQQIAAENPAVPSCRAELGRAHKTLASVLHCLKNDTEAEKHYRLSLTIAQKLADDFADVIAYRHDVAASYAGLGNMFQVRGRMVEAEEQYRRGLAIEQKLAAEHPDVPSYQFELGKKYVNFARLMIQLVGREADALEYSTRAIPLLEDAVRRDGKNVAAITALCYANWGQADALQQLCRYPEALAAWDKAIALNREADSRSWLLSQRAVCLAHTGDFAKALSAVDEVLSGKEITFRKYYDAARTLALCAAADHDPVRKQERTERAMELLQKAVNAGYKNAAHMKNDTDLDTLRERDDFKRLLAELEKKAEKK